MFQALFITHHAHSPHTGGSQVWLHGAVGYDVFENERLWGTDANGTTYAPANTSQHWSWRGWRAGDDVIISSSDAGGVPAYNTIQRISIRTIFGQNVSIVDLEHPLTTSHIGTTVRVTDTDAGSGLDIEVDGRATMSLLSRNVEVRGGTPHLTPHTSHHTPHTSRHTPHTAHRTPHTAHRTPHTAHRTTHIAHSTPHAAHSTQYTDCNTQHTARRAAYCVLHAADCTPHSSHTALLPAACFLPTERCTLLTHIACGLHCLVDSGNCELVHLASHLRPVRQVVGSG